MLRTFIALLLFTCCGAIGCSTQTLRVQTAPEGADVTILVSGRSPQKMGKTPLELTSKSNPEIFTQSFQVQVSKDGYQPQTALIPKAATTGSTGRINFNLEDTTLPKVCQGQEDSFNEMARGVAEVSTNVQRKKYQEASVLVQSLIAKYNGVSVLYDLQGNIYYLQKDLTRSLEAYKKSNSLYPNNPQTIRMINRIQQLQGLPAGGG